VLGDVSSLVTILQQGKHLLPMSDQTMLGDDATADQKAPDVQQEDREQPIIIDYRWNENVKSTHT
jgi:hypothetical protein